MIDEGSDTTGLARETAERCRALALERKKAGLVDRLQDGRLALWSETERGIPNELVRCAIFSARNRNVRRAFYRAASPLVLPIIGGGVVSFHGEELRQDDETVWLQLVHMAKETRGETVAFTPHSFIHAIRWPDNGASYKRLLVTLKRLKGAFITIHSSRLDKVCSVGLIRDFAYSSHDRRKPWTVDVFGSNYDLLLPFDALYSRVDWEVRLSLPEGLATWLHGFFASHHAPYDHRIETLVLGAGLVLETSEDAALEPAAREAKRKARLREAKRLFKHALEALVRVGFLERYEITPDGLVRVVRARRQDNSAA